MSGKSALHCSEEGDARNETDGRTVRSDRSIDRFEIEARNDLLSLCSDRRIACKQRSRGGRARSRVQTIIATLFAESINHLCLIANRSCFCLADSADSRRRKLLLRDDKKKKYYLLLEINYRGKRTTSDTFKFSNEL